MNENNSQNRVYIASKFGMMEAVVQELKEQLEERGYQIIYDWTVQPVPKPFQDHKEEVSRASRDMTEAVMKCDVLIVLCAPNGIGLHVETGGAMVASIILSLITGQKRKKIYVVGEGNDRSVFYFDESVTRVNSVDELLSLMPNLS